jgi:hypothetical protein
MRSAPLALPNADVLAAALVEAARHLLDSL